MQPRYSNDNLVVQVLNSTSLTVQLFVDTGVKAACGTNSPRSPSFTQRDAAHKKRPMTKR